MFSLTGIPPTAGFVGKLYLFLSAIHAGYMWLVIIAVIFSAISAFFYLRIVMFMYMRDPKEEVTLTTSASTNTALGITVAAVLFIGIFPSYLLGFAKAALAAF
jgi:NADH-quinone oxidoreductase subunit N